MNALGGGWAAAILPWLVEASLLTLVALFASRRLHRLSPSLRTAILAVPMLKWLVPPGFVPWSVVGYRFAFGLEAPVGRASSVSVSNWVVALALLHLVGIAICGLGLIRRLLVLRRLRRRAGRASFPAPVHALDAAVEGLGLRTRPGLVVSDEVAAPFATGLVRPAVVVPRQLVELLSPTALASLIAHEAAHVRLGDIYLAWLGALMRVLWWFHPLVHRLAAEAEEVWEERCDDHVIACGLAVRETYCQALVDAATVSSRFPRVAPVAGAFGRAPRGLERRLRRLLRGGEAGAGLGAASLLLGLVLALVALPPVLRGGHPAAPGDEVRYLHLGDARHDHRHGHGH